MESRPLQLEPCNSQRALADSPGFWGLLIGGLLVLYVLPSLIGAIRRVEGLGWLIVVNLIPTGIGWLAATVLAFMLPRRDPRTSTRFGTEFPQSVCRRSRVATWSRRDR
jgi:hypothetical protein